MQCWVNSGIFHQTSVRCTKSVLPASDIWVFLSLKLQTSAAFFSYAVIASKAMGASS